MEMVLFNLLAVKITSNEPPRLPFTNRNKVSFKFSPWPALAKIQVFWRNHRLRIERQGVDVLDAPFSVVFRETLKMTAKETQESVDFRNCLLHSRHWNQQLDCQQCDDDFDDLDTRHPQRSVVRS
jgi:hypothetical protein